MKSKQDMRKQLEQGMSVYLSQGKVITKASTVSKRKKQTKEKEVEIEYEYLPMTLQKKYFGV